MAPLAVALEDLQRQAGRFPQPHLTLGGRVCVQGLLESQGGQVHSRLGIVGFKAKGLGKGLRRHINPAILCRGNSQVDENVCRRTACRRPAQKGCRLVGAPGVEKNPSQVGLRLRPLGAQPQRLPVGGFRCLRTPRLLVENAHVVPRHLVVGSKIEGVPVRGESAIWLPAPVVGLSYSRPHSPILRSLARGVQPQNQLILPDAVALDGER